MVVAMATMSLSPQQYQQMVDRVAGLEAMMTNLQSHAESQQEQIRVAELVIQQFRTAGTPTNPPPLARGTSLRQVTEGGWCFQGTDEVRGKPLRAPRLVLQRKTSSHKSGREICRTAAVDLGNHRRDLGERCARVSKNDGSQHGGLGLAKLRAVRVVSPQDVRRGAGIHSVTRGS